MSASLALNRLTLELQVSGEEAGSDKALCREIARALPEHLAECMADDDGPVLLIRRMTVELSHNAGNGADAIAARLAEAIARGIAKVRGANAGAIQFPNRAAFAAAYLRARLDGTVSGRWWFRSFEGLSALADSAMLRTLLGRDWSTALDVFAACDESTLARLWPELDRRDAAVILAHVAEAGDGVAERPGVPDWTDIAGLLLAALDDGLSPDVAILAAVVASVGRDRHVEAWHCAAIAGQLQPVLASLAKLPRAVGNPPRRIELAELPQWTVLARAQGLPPVLIAALEDRVGPDASATGVRSVSQRRASDWLGYAMLWPFASNIVPPGIGDWPAPDQGMRGADLLQLLVLSTCAGGEGLLRDGVWRDLFGVPGPCSAQQIGNWAARVGPDLWSALAVGEPEPDGPAAEAIQLAEARRALARCSGLALRRFAASLPGFADSTPEFLRENLLSAGGAVRFDAQRVQAKLRRPPLDVLLGITGLADRTFELAGGRMLMLERTR